MENFLKMKEDLDKIIKNDFEIYEDDDDPPPKLEAIKSTTPSTSDPATVSATVPDPAAADPAAAAPLSDRLAAFFHRANLERLVESNLFQVCVLILVVLDCVFVVLELLVDLKALSLGENVPGLAVFFHVTSFTILNIFMLEIFLKIYIFQLEFLKQKFEVFDAVVVLVAWCLDVAFIHSESSVRGFELIVILRLWRVARVLNGIIQGLRTRNLAKLKKQKDIQEALQVEVDRLKASNAKLEAEAAELRSVARKYGVPDSAIPGSPEGASPSSRKNEMVVQMTRESEYL